MESIPDEEGEYTDESDIDEMDDDVVDAQVPPAINESFECENADDDIQPMLNDQESETTDPHQGDVNSSNKSNMWRRKDVTATSLPHMNCSNSGAELLCISRDYRLQDRGLQYIIFADKRALCEVCSQNGKESRPFSHCKACCNKGNNWFLDYHEIFVCNKTILIKCGLFPTGLATGSCSKSSKMDVVDMMDIKHNSGIDNVCADALSRAMQSLLRPIHMYVSFCHTLCAFLISLDVTENLCPSWSTLFLRKGGVMILYNLHSAI